MKNALQNIDEVLLMGPGPSCVAPAVYEAMARKTLGHMDASFLAIMDEIKGQLQTVLQTGNRLTIPVSGTGSAGMEACFVNLVEKSDKVLVLINGVFGKRMEDVAGRLGADVDALEFEWGGPVIADRVKAQLEKSAYKIVAIVHAETSTGVANPVKEVGALLEGTDALYLVDAVKRLRSDCRAGC